MTILVTGSTGTVGREIVEQLHATGAPVRALTHSPDPSMFPDGVEVVRGDLSDPSTLPSALKGISALHLITFAGSGYAPLEQPDRILGLAVSAGVQRVTVMSGYHVGRVEEAVARSGLEYTVLNPVEFMSNALWEWAPAIRTGTPIRVPFPRLRSPKVHPADIAAVAVEVLRHGGYHGRTLELTGPEALTSEESLEIIRSISGRPAESVELGEAESWEQLRTEGFSDSDIEEIVGEEAEEDPAPISPVVPMVTGRPARAFAQWATDHAEAFRPHPGETTVN